MEEDSDKKRSAHFYIQQFGDMAVPSWLYSQIYLHLIPCPRSKSNSIEMFMESKKVTTPQNVMRVRVLMMNAIVHLWYNIAHFGASLKELNVELVSEISASVGLHYPLLLHVALVTH